MHSRLGTESRLSRRTPFGGRKGSSYGPREQGRYAAEFYTAVKTAYTFDLNKP